MLLRTLRNPMATSDRPLFQQVLALPGIEG